MSHQTVHTEIRAIPGEMGEAQWCRERTTHYPQLPDKGRLELSPTTQVGIQMWDLSRRDQHSRKKRRNMGGNGMEEHYVI